jgi:hypothetical protein
MAYYDKYKFTFATRANKTAYLYLREDLGSAPAIIEYQGMELNLQYIPNSDDPFEPIFASQLGIAIDITDDIENIPNLTTLDDRKYFAILYLDDAIEWCGWVLSDSVQISFSTGRRQMSFNAIDGLGMLKSIPLPQSFEESINNTNNLAYFLGLCFDSVGLPTNPNIVIVCSYFAVGMDDRSVQPYNEPFIQTYLPYRTFLASPSTYTNCLEILTNIIKSFGCRVFQAGGKWWIVAINEFANNNALFTEYTYNGIVDNYGTIDTLSTIQGYVENNSNLYFINNSQVKLLKKGFNKILIENSITYPDNYMTNWDLRPAQNPNQPYNWNPSYTGSGSSYVLNDNPNDAYATWVLTRGPNPIDKVIIYNVGLPNVANGDSLTYSMSFTTGNASNAMGYVQFFITPTSGPVLYMDYDGTWSNNSNRFATVTTTQSYVPFNFSVSSKAFPIDGQLSFAFWLDYTSINTVEVGNFKLSLQTPLVSATYSSYRNSSKEYVNNVSIPYGFHSLGLPYSLINPLEKGVLLLSNYQQTIDWRRYPDMTSYTSLQELLTQQYLNVFGNNIINVDCDLSSFSTANGILNASKLIKAEDTDPEQINISNLPYMLGNATISYPNDQTRATLLQISNTEIEGTLTKNYNFQPSQF